MKSTTKKDIVEEIIKLLILQEKAICKGRVHSAGRVGNLLHCKAKEIQNLMKKEEKALTIQQINKLNIAWAKTKNLIEEVGQVCDKFFYEEENENYNQSGKRIKKKRIYKNCSLKA